MKKRMICVMLAAIILSLSAELEAGAAAVGAQTQTAPRMTDEQWRKSPTGSAGVLEGKAVIVSIFVNDANSKWSKKAKKKANRKMKAAGKYIRAQAKRYGKKVQLVTDIYENKGISKTYTTKMKLNDSAGSQDRLYRKLQKWMDANINLTKLRESYGTDSIGFVFHINKSGNSSTLMRERIFMSARRFFPGLRGKKKAPRRMPMRFFICSVQGICI